MEWIWPHTNELKQTRLFIGFLWIFAKLASDCVIN